MDRSIKTVLVALVFLCGVQVVVANPEDTNKIPQKYLDRIKKVEFVCRGGADQDDLVEPCRINGISTRCSTEGHQQLCNYLGKIKYECALRGACLCPQGLQCR